MVSSDPRCDVEFYCLVMLSGSTVLRVRPCAGGAGWEVMEPAAAALLRAKERQVAARLAPSSLERGGVIETLGLDGQVVASEPVEGPSQRPRWYVPARRSTWALVVFLPLFTLVSTLLQSPGELDWWLSLGTFLLSLVFVTLTIRSGRRDRRLS